MDENSHNHAEKAAEKQASFPRKAVIQFVIITAIFPLILFLVSGDWRWKQAWVFYAIHLVFSYVGRWIAWRRNPDLLAERGRHREHQDAMPGDQQLVLWAAVILPLVVWVVAAIEHRLVQPAVIPQSATWIAGVIVGIGYLIGNWAFIVNQFFSAVVRLQSERKQVVVSQGPYAIVRHPGYAGGILAYLAIPILLGSLWALLPTLINILLVILRTSREDIFLKQKLDGYQAYTEKVKYRLLPWVW
ncbi:MAG TPA: isoprenylcysteine carboxylmethyltransferase family protein [Anaerolineales bacterium]|nr:isoprenylcysteine carboxylmethyltransferase family protein [Anaerolineales bacterium]